jgi:small-conductance mechanosensitive channel
MDVQSVLSQEFLGNSWERWAVALGVFLGVLLLSWAIRAFFVARLRLIAPKTTVKWDDMVLQLLERTHFLFFFLVALHLGLRSLSLHPKIDNASHFTFFLVMFLQVGFWANHAITFLGLDYAERSLAKDAARATTVRALLVFGKIVIWITVGLLLLDNWGVKVAPFIAGLGVGGVAIALAVQNILGDLFASLSIVLDKPFVIGDFIAVGSEMGTVEYIGLKTTRVKSLSGEQLVFSNSDLLQSRIRNYKRMWERRVDFSFGVIYQTPTDKLNRVREIVKEIFTGIEGARLDRCHLHAFGPSSLDFQVVYWVTSPDYNVFIEKHHSMAVRLIDSFRAEGIEFAYPTQTLYLDGKIVHEPAARA